MEASGDQRDTPIMSPIKGIDVRKQYNNFNNEKCLRERVKHEADICKTISVVSDA